MVTMTASEESNVLTVKVSGKLSKEDYREFVPRVEEQIRKHGKIRVLFEMDDFQGWEAGALWADIKFDLKHFKDIERLAFVGDKKWESGMAAFCKPFTTATVRYYDRSRRDEADQWIEA